MKKIVFFVMATLFVVSCGQKTNESAVSVDTVDTLATEEVVDTTEVIEEVEVDGEIASEE